MSGDIILFFIAVAAPFVLGRLTILFFRRLVAGGRRRGWLVLLAGNGLILLLLLSCVFLGWESYYRFVHDTTIGNNRSKVSQQWFKRHWHRNRMGVRDDVEYLMKRIERQRRLTFLGDSFTTGHGVEDVNQRFVNRIRVRHPDWDVHCMAKNGWSSVDHFETLGNLERQGYEFDMLVLVYFINDILPFVNQTQMPSQHSQQPRSWPTERLIDHSYVINTLYHQWRRRRLRSSDDGLDYFTLVTTAYTGEPWDHQRALLLNMRNAMTDQNAKFAVVTFPLTMQRARDNESVYEIHRKLAAFWRECDVPHLDLLPVFKPFDLRQLTVNRHDGHPNSFAHGLAAEAIDGFLQEIFLKNEAGGTVIP